MALSPTSDFKILCYIYDVNVKDKKYWNTLLANNVILVRELKHVLPLDMWMSYLKDDLTSF